MFELSIKVLGVGSAGAKIVAAMAEKFVPNKDVKVTFMGCDSDREKLRSLSDKGTVLMHLQSAETLTESEDNVLREYFEYADITIICTGMGGRTGSNIAPLAAKIAKETGSLVIGITTMPFKFERGNKTENASRGFAGMKVWCDAVFTAFTQEDIESYDKPLRLNELLDLIESRYLDIAQSFADMICKSKPINIDISDLHTALRDVGETDLIAVTASGVNRISEAVNAVCNNLSDDVKLLIINVLVSQDTLLCEIDDLIRSIVEKFGDEVKIIYSFNFTNSEPETIKTVIIAG